MTLSTDKPEEIRKSRSKHGLRATMLSDRDLAVTDRFNLRNARGLRPPGMAALPIPTTILVDAEGVVGWIDQTDDDRVRSHPDRVSRALREGLA